MFLDKLGTACIILFIMFASHVDIFQVSLLKSLPLRLYANLLAFDEISLSACFDWTNVSVPIDLARIKHGILLH